MPKTRAIAFYLPQYHPIPENDEWWGKGFTEWRNVVSARPLFPGHYQPHIPADLGFYDLRLPEAREAQAALAREHGIHGFCYYHYWFNGRRVLERPFNEVLASGKPEFPFCLCWANENWTRVWDGGDKHVLLEQNYSTADDVEHFNSLIPAFLDKRYIRIDGRPLFLVYRAELLPDPARTAEIWRDLARRAGIGEIYLAKVENLESYDPGTIGFDASVEFAPDNVTIGKILYRDRVSRWLAAARVIPRAYLDHTVSHYGALAEGMMRRESPEFNRFRCVTPGWDNTARRKQGGWIYVESTPEKFGEWLRSAVRKTEARFQGDERIVFINAWNEWAEGNHLEPDLEWGRAYLEQAKSVLVEHPPGTPAQEKRVQGPRDRDPTIIRRLYWRVRHHLREQKRFLKTVLLRRRP